MFKFITFTDGWGLLVKPKTFRTESDHQNRWGKRTNTNFLDQFAVHLSLFYLWLSFCVPTRQRKLIKSRPINDKTRIIKGLFLAELTTDPPFPLRSAEQQNLFVKLRSRFRSCEGQEAQNCEGRFHLKLSQKVSVGCSSIQLIKRNEVVWLLAPNGGVDWIFFAHILW